MCGRRRCTSRSGFWSSGASTLRRLSAGCSSSCHQHQQSARCRRRRQWHGQLPATSQLAQGRAGRMTAALASSFRAQVRTTVLYLDRQAIARHRNTGRRLEDGFCSAASCDSIRRRQTTTVPRPLTDQRTASNHASFSSDVATCAKQTTAMTGLMYVDCAAADRPCSCRESDSATAQQRRRERGYGWPAVVGHARWHCARLS